MGMQLHLTGLPSTHHITRASPWMKRSPTSSPFHVPSSKRAKDLYARGRGFGVAITNNKKTRQEKDDNVSNNRNNNSGDSGEEEEEPIPQVVFNRMISRIAFYVGAPMASGIILLYVLSLLKERHLWEAPGWLPFLTALFSFGTSALGIAYGTLSTSWDPNKEGSLLGWEEAQKNWPELWKEEDDR